MMKRIFLLSFCLIFILAGCLNENSSKKELDYDQTKKMVVDILQTDEGKKVLREIIADDKMKQHLIMDSDTVQQSMTKILDTKASTTMWQRLFEDPEFVKAYQASMEDEQKELFKIKNKGYKNKADNIERTRKTTIVPPPCPLSSEVVLKQSLLPAKRK